MTDHNNHEESAFCFPFNNASEELRGMFKKENTLLCFYLTFVH